MFSDVVPELILTYLKQHRRLVVPSLGAFIVKGHGGECDNILFSELLKSDDGVLRGLLTERGLRDIEAAAMVDRFIFEVKHAASPDGEEFVIEGVGVFGRSEAGKLQFTFDPECVNQATEATEATEVTETVETVETAGTIETTETVEPDEPTEIVEELDEEDDKPLQATTTTTLGSAEERRTKTTAPSAESYRAQRIKELYESTPKQSFRDEDPSIKGLQYGKKVKQRDAYSYAKHQKPKTDKVLMAAIVAAIIAVGVIAYGYYVSEIVPQGGFEVFWSNITGNKAVVDEVSLPQEVNYTSEGAAIEGEVAE